ncbi:MAG: hypothetical protein NZ480_04020 [Bdellovibrionaceae bacterium]|nr:hypothetical protein [Pseudobdellovibrionaceae bacterium]MDW8189989.1 hypothetical protein [Pseudobdellovibrionaceae bacterium]
MWTDFHCEWQCRSVWQKQEHNTDQTVQHQSCSQVQHIFNQLSPLKCLEYFGESLWEGIVSLPQQVQLIYESQKAYWKNVADNINQKHQKLRLCEVNLMCKIQLSKNLLEFKNISVNDPKIEQFASNHHITVILDRLEKQKFYQMKYCQDLLNQYRKNTNNEEIQASHPHPLSSFVRKNPDCAFLIQQNSAPFLKEYFHQLGITLKCYPPHEVMRMACTALGEIMADPLAILTGTGLLTVRFLKYARSNSPFYKDRKFFTERYLNYRATSVKENQEWMAAASAATVDSKKTFLSLEITQLKTLNDTLKDKDFVTALVNLHKEIFMQNLQAWKSKHPNLKLQVYSDYKSIRLAIEQSPNPTLIKDLEKIIIETNQKFVDILRKNQLVRSSPSSLRVIDYPEQWFQAGWGETADQAEIAVRQSRFTELDQEPKSNRNTTVLPGYQDGEIQNQITQNLNQVKQINEWITNDPRFKNVLDSNQTIPVPSTEFFDVLRKEKFPNQLIHVIQDQYSITITESEANKLLDYLKSIEKFSLSPWIAKRDIPSVTSATHGALSIDFRGIGGENIKQTAVALVTASKIDQAILQARQAEKMVTHQFRKKMYEREKIIRSYLEHKKHLHDLDIKCSGDDCVVIFPQAITPKDQRELVQRLSKTTEPDRIRIAFVSDRVEQPEMRSQMANHGEAIEKEMRKLLKNDFNDNTLSKITIGIAMRGKRSGEGAVNLIIGNSQVRLTPSQIQKIQQKFEQAVQQINQNLLSQGKHGYYVPLDLQP